jgi:hypothetical protein
LGRTVLVATSAASASRTLAAVSLFVVLALALASPVAAQEGEGQAPARAADPLQGAAVTVASDDGGIERIEIAAADCTVDKGATVTVKSGEKKQVFSNIGDNLAKGASNIRATDDQVVITDIEDDLNGGLGTPKTGEVADSSGIACGRDAASGNKVDKEDEALENLGCAELLVLFRGDGDGQYVDASELADNDVRARIELCLEKEILEGTAAEEDLPDTGGLSLLGLAVLGVVSAAAGLSVVRGGRR